MPLSTNRLWVVAVPLGNPGDLSPRARDILTSADVVLAEDTRRTGQLLRRCGLRAHRLLSFHEHNEGERQEEVLRLLHEGSSIALVSDAGTPLVADPGYRLVRACRREGLPVSPVPGPSAPVAALSAAGIAPLPYSFLGFLPRDAAGRDALFRAFATTPCTLVFFERKDRIKDSLTRAAAILGPRDVAICRELTKEYEEFIFGRLEAVHSLPDALLGEVTICIGPPEQKGRTSEEEVCRCLREALRCGDTPRQTVRFVQQSVQGWSGKEVYALLQELRTNGDVSVTGEACIPPESSWPA